MWYNILVGFITLGVLISFVTFVIMYTTPWDVVVFSYTAGFWLFILVICMIWSYRRLHKIINHLFDGKLSPEFLLLRKTFLFLVIAFTIESAFFGCFDAYYFIVCNEFIRWLIQEPIVALFSTLIIIPIIYLHSETGENRAEQS